MASEVAALLQESRGLHNASKSFRQMDGQGNQVGSDRLRNNDQLRRARDLRMQAHALDPQHTDPAWRAEQRFTQRRQDTHEALMAFYAGVLGG